MVVTLTVMDPVFGPVPLSSPQAASAAAMVRAQRIRAAERTERELFMK
jgi:hypothetical protein